MHLLRRFLFQIPLLALIAALAFALIRAAPGGPFDRDRKPLSPEVERVLRARYRLDDPLWKQFGAYLGGIVRGDLGPSLKYRNHTVNDIVAQGLPVSMTLGGLAFIFAAGVGVPLGLVAAARKGGAVDHIASLVALLGVCVPSLVLGPLLLMAFAVHLRWCPVGLWGSPAHAVLPTLTLGLYFAGRIARLMRAGMLEVRSAPFMTTARAKGLGETALMLRHGLRLAMVPVVSYSGPLLADLLTGSFVVENLFQIPGVGVFLVNSALNRDYPMVTGLVLVYAVLLLGLNLLVDLAYAWLDPRVRPHP